LKSPERCSARDSEGSGDRSDHLSHSRLKTPEFSMEVWERPIEGPFADTTTIAAFRVHPWISIIWQIKNVILKKWYFNFENEILCLEKSQND
jgi:hypothetical protein